MEGCLRLGNQGADVKGPRTRGRGYPAIEGEHIESLQAVDRYF